MNSRRFMPFPKLIRRHRNGLNECFDRLKSASKTLPQCTANVSVGSKGEILAPSTYSPLCPRKQTQVGPRRRSVSCQVRTYASHQTCSYSITLSACATNPAGISRPSSLAALRLMTSSQRISWKNGISAGLPPFSISTICAAIRRSPAFKSKA
jgi:hypothetical protein